MEKLRALKASNTRFAKLLEEYDAANDKVHRAETRVDTVDTLVESDLRKQRAVLKDQIARMLAEA